MRTHRRFVRVFTVTGLLVIATLASIAASAQTLVNTYNDQFPPPAAVPFPRQTAGDISFVRDGTAAVVNGRLRLTGEVVFTSLTYPLQLKAGAFDPVDSLFGICYGGGYVTPLSAASAAGVSVNGYTIAASTAWYQTSRNDSNFDGGPRNRLFNFLNSWRDGVRTLPADGMQSYFTFASIFAPFMPPQPAANLPNLVNYAIYASPDAPGGGGSNNTRTLGDQNLGQANQQRQFAILVSWSRPQARHAANVLRYYDLLTRELAVPANRIVILHGNPAPAALGVFPGPINDDANGLLPPLAPGGALRQAPVNGANTEANWTSALAGNMFMANGQRIRPQGGDKLFIMHTGHGGLKSDKVPAAGRVLPAGVDYNVDVEQKYNLYISGDPNLDTTVADQASDGVTLEQNLQFSFLQMLPPGTHLILNGNDLGPLDADLVTSPSESLPIAPFVTQPVFNYRLTAPQSDFTDLNHIDYLFSNPSSPSNAALASLVAIDISGGDQEWLLLVAGPPDIAVSNGGAVRQGTILTLPLSFANTGGLTADNVTLSSVNVTTPGAFAGPTLPVTIGNIAPGASSTQSVQINAAGLGSGSIAHIHVNGSYQDGGGANFQFSSVRGVKIP